MKTPKGVCVKCGNAKGTKSAGTCTMWIGECVYCGKKGAITAKRDFGIMEEQTTKGINDLLDFFAKL